MQFSEILASAPGGEEAWTVSVPDSWLQGRSVFGGLQSALALRSMKPRVPANFALRILQTTFVAPVPEGEVRVESRLLRTGKSTAHVESRIVRGADTAALVVGVFGAARRSRVRVSPERTETEVTAGFDFPFASGAGPNYARHFSIRWISGGLPFTATPTPEAIAELGMPGEPTTTVEHIVALADVMPPVALSYLDAPARGSSVTWTLEMLTDEMAKCPVRGFRADATLVAARDGYTSQSVLISGPAGEPIALSRQNMFVFE